MNHPQSYEKYLKVDCLLEYEDLYELEEIREHDVEEKGLKELLEKNPQQMIKPEKERLVVILRAKGFSIKEICERAQWSKPTVIDVIRNFAKEIEKLSRLEFQELVALYKQTTFRKIQVFGGILGQLLDEMQHRNLADIPTERLLDIILKYNKVLGDSIGERIATMPTKEPEASDEGELNKAGIF